MASGRLRPWADLPRDILSSISDGLPIIDLLSFRGTCKDFRSASSNASAEIESSRSPWLLFHKIDSPKCLIYNENESKTYKRNIQDLEGTICLASYQGWLLLFKEGSIFFFSPFSLAKIPLPDFPHKQINGHVGAFSDLPTSPHCIVSIVNKTEDDFVEIKLLSKGQTAWTEHKEHHRLHSTFCAAIFVHEKQTFYYLDGEKSVLAYAVKEKKYNSSNVVVTENKDGDLLPYGYLVHMSRYIIENKKHQLDIEDDEYFAVCGLTYQHEEHGPLLYLNEVEEDVSPTKTRMRRAVWIQPRFYEAHLNMIW